MKGKLKVFSAIIIIVVIIFTGAAFYLNAKKVEKVETPKDIPKVNTGDEAINEKGEKSEVNTDAKEDEKKDEVKSQDISPSVSTTKEEEIKQNQKRPETVYAEEIVSNFERIYPEVISYTDIDFSMIGSLVAKDAPYYSKLKNEVEQERAKKINIKLDGFTIKSIKEINNKEYKVYVDEKIVVNSGDQKTIKNNKWVFTVKVDENVSIINRETWS